MPLPVGTGLTTATAPTSGVFQVETATIVGTVTGSGDATITVTAAGMTGSPIALSVPVINADTATVVAGKVRTALAANAVIAAFFTIGGTAADIILTRTVSKANDATLNLASTNGTCTGLTPAASSANTTAGVAGTYRGVDSGQYCVDTTGGVIYQNTGDANRPVWTLI